MYGLSLASIWTPSIVQNRNVFVSRQIANHYSLLFKLLQQIKFITYHVNGIKSILCLETTKTKICLANRLG